MQQHEFGGKQQLSPDGDIGFGKIFGKYWDGSARGQYQLSRDTLVKFRCSDCY
jgi:hypothetical protein